MPAPATLLLVVLLCGSAAATRGRGAAAGRGEASHGSSMLERARQEDREVTKVVKLLQSMLKTSQTQGEEERVLFAKNKCYCDTTVAEKTARIETLEEDIALISNKIDETRADTALLSQEVAKTEAAIADTNTQLATLTEIHTNEMAEFEKNIKDASDTKELCTQAVDVLREIGADQSLAAADNTQWMAAYTGLIQTKDHEARSWEPSARVSLLKLQTALKQASVAATTLSLQGHAKTIESLLQASSKGKAPFTAAYAAQSGEVFGILKDMRDKFAAAEEAQTTARDAAAEAYAKMSGLLTGELGELSEWLSEVQGKLSKNDDSLATKLSELEDAKIEKADAEEFLSELTRLCSEKKAQYDKRLKLRAREDAAITQAISILDSDMAFESFGRVQATSSGYKGPAASFLQVEDREGRPHTGSAIQRKKVGLLLRQVAKSKKSLRAAKIAVMLEADNPFTTVLEEIKKMLDVIGEEEQVDQEKFRWCEAERANKTDTLLKAEGEISTLKSQIAELDATISDPVTGLKAVIQATEDDLKTNSEDQATETASRTTENLAYQKNIENLVEAQGLLSKAIVVLKAYYEDALTAGASGTGLLQREGEDPNLGESWAGEYTGQSPAGGDAVKMLEFIRDTVIQEETDSHQSENDAQKEYEEFMQGLKAHEATLQQVLVDRNEELATSEELKQQREADLAAMEEVKATTEAYLKEIKPGCDFIKYNLATRQANRMEEASALNQSVVLLKETPAYKNAMDEAHNETLGDCLQICATSESEEHVDCMACRAKVSVPGFCAGHPDTAGCPK